jgi:hypothetical protein
MTGGVERVWASWCWLGSDGLRYAAIEAKGLEGSCREAHLREVSVWMAEVDLAVSMTAEERGPDQKSYLGRLKELPMSTDGPERACKGSLAWFHWRVLIASFCGRASHQNVSST